MARLISPEEVTTLPRGRKPNLNPKVTAVLEQLSDNPEKVLVVDDLWGKVSTDDRARVRAEIRKHWKALTGGESGIRVRYSPEGFPQVDIKA